MKLYSTLTRSVEPFVPLAPPKVTIYVCGPTVYDEPHIGHARSAFIFDVLRRYLRHRKLQVTFVRNVTDVDDKIIEKARQETRDKRQEADDLNEKCQEVAERYLAKYHEAMDRLGIEQPDLEPRATAHVTPDMTDGISKLLLQGAAYEAGGPACRSPDCRAQHGEGRDVYFAVRKCERYGALSNRTLDDLKAGTRVEPGEHKQNPLDFALWKAAKPGEPSWPSPWGRGRPGWHIECSTMSTKYLGETFDIHGGGVDLLFPHHENEIAQAQAAGLPFARWWVHNGLLTVKGEKMSKSLGNFITVDQAIKECGGDGDTLKLFFLSAHYRSPLDYTMENLIAAGGRLDNWTAFLEEVEEKRGSTTAPSSPPPEIVNLRREFDEAMDDDLNTPRALAAMDKLVNIGDQWQERWMLRQAKEASDVRHRSPTEDRMLQDNIVLAAETLLNLANGLGLLIGHKPTKVQLTPEQESRLVEREAARKRKDFEAADRIRRQFEEAGLLIEDTARGPVVRQRR